MMTPKKGIDVSKYQGTINWETVKPNIDFVIIRAGYSTTVDAMFRVNADECTRLGIPFGVYWFSYATNETEARTEADTVCDTVKKYKLTYPICFDYEYDSDRYAKECGITPTNSYRVAIAKAFLERVEQRGYFATIYSNPDYLNKGFSSLINRYDLWLAHWGISKPSRSCGMWQSSCTGQVNGIKGNVDTDFTYKDYPTIIANKGLNHLNDNEQEQETETKTDKELQLEKLKNETWEEYYNLAEEIISGKWGNGTDRIKALHSEGYDYGFAQSIVNILTK